MNGERKYTQTEVDQMLEVAREEGREEFGGLVALEAERRWHEVDVFTKADVEQMLEVARAEERAAIVAWLREQGKECRNPTPAEVWECSALREAASEIEVGYHHE